FGPGFPRPTRRRTAYFLAPFSAGGALAAPAPAAGAAGAPGAAGEPAAGTPGAPGAAGAAAPSAPGTAATAAGFGASSSFSGPLTTAMVWSPRTLSFTPAGSFTSLMWSDS